MTDKELLPMVEAVLLKAVEDAEFTRARKDIEYVRVCAQKLENLRSRMRRSSVGPAQATRAVVEHGCVYVEWFIYDTVFQREELKRA
jgi:hypothetical protein